MTSGAHGGGFGFHEYFHSSYGASTPYKTHRKNYGHEFWREGANGGALDFIPNSKVTALEDAVSQVYLLDPRFRGVNAETLNGGEQGLGLLGQMIAEKNGIVDTQYPNDPDIQTALRKQGKTEVLIPTRNEVLTNLGHSTAPPARSPHHPTSPPPPVAPPVYRFPIVHPPRVQHHHYHFQQNNFIQFNQSNNAWGPQYRWTPQFNNTQQNQQNWFISNLEQPGYPNWHPQVQY